MSETDVPWSYNNKNSNMSGSGGGGGGGGGGGWTTNANNTIPGLVDEDATLRQQKLLKQRELMEQRVARKRQSAGLMQPSERAKSARSRPRTANNTSNTSSNTTTPPSLTNNINQNQNKNNALHVSKSTSQPVLSLTHSLTHSLTRCTRGFLARGPSTTTTTYDISYDCYLLHRRRGCRRRFSTPPLCPPHSNLLQLLRPTQPKTT
ncbi:hypothetical protein Pmani_023396 [Petrolisthes manimaculis]|uniref:Uncharacterized protein n=1 Tax=Petrolisthes manimaculis TaxID=1843537 RepID=A0AAE1PBW7_9EUCA|nr:hypothetical protein Pmani_023396 [Petrolisthes manimaculis]